jgi:hypothetical protein
MSNVTFVFDAEPHHRLILDESKPDEVIYGGQEFTVGSERAVALLADPSLPLKEAQQQLGKLSRDELHDVAAAAGVDSPEQFGTKADLIDAIEHPETTDPQSEVQ